MIVEEGRTALSLVHKAPSSYVGPPFIHSHSHPRVILDPKPLPTPVVHLFNKQSLMCLFHARPSAGHGDRRCPVYRGHGLGHKLEKPLL